MFLFAALASGCSKSVPAALTNSASGWTLALTVVPDHPRMVRPVTFDLHLADGAGKPVENAQVTGSLNMTLMDMGKIAVKFEPKSNGDYEVTVQSFDMSGPWELTADAGQGAIRTHKVFQLTIFH